MSIKKVGAAFVFFVALSLIALTSAMALTNYEDTGADDDIARGDGGASVVCNGDFAPDRWTGPDGAPECWDLMASEQSGWVKHFANINMAIVGDTAGEYGMNRSLGMFVRNVGGAGPAYMYATQSLDGIEAAGHYWVQVHATMFAEYPFLPLSNGIVVFDPIIANSVAWYAISDEADPTMVDSSEWREMFLNQFDGIGIPGVLACPNGLEFCGQMGRYENLYLEPGQYLHLKAGHKFSTFNIWTVFEFDDISIVPIDMEAEEEDLSGFWLDGELVWDENGIR